MNIAATKPGAFGAAFFAFSHCTPPEVAIFNVVPLRSARRRRSQPQGQCPVGAVGMNCRQHATMTGIQSIEKCACFSSTHFAYNDPVWPMPQDRLQQLVERNRGPVSVLA